MKKGITPIIAIIILLLITMALAAAAWAFIQGYMGTLTSTSFSIPPEAYGCASGTITVFITNTGQDTIIPSEDIEMCLLDGAQCPAADTLLSVVPISPGEGPALALTIENQPIGAHTVKLGAGLHTAQVAISC